MDKFIELKREFEALREESEDAATRRSYALASDDGATYGSWDALLKHRLAVILGEPGSGKSTELDSLHRRRGDSFLLRLDRLVSEPVSALMSEFELERFRRWKKGDFEALFLLDAVDESKLGRDVDFAVAIERLTKEIGPALSRARFVVTSRVSEWRVQTDLDVLTRNLIPRRAARKIGQALKNGDGRIQYVSDEENNTAASEAVVVILKGLTPSQVRTYVEARGAQDSGRFMEALENSNTVVFAGRPIDVSYLYDYWLATGHLASLTGVVEFTVARLLAEVSDKEKTDPLSPEMAREGAEYLAAAATFCKTLRFHIPDDARFGVGPHLSPAAILPEHWLPGARRALMNRAMFDSPSRGALSFHHRLHIEYLTAQWVERLMANNCTFEALRALLFAMVNGSLVLRRSLEPVAAWLVREGQEPWRQLLSALILNVAPEIHFRYGDPGALPLPYRRQVLDAIVAKYGGRQYVGVRFSPDALSRLADTQLAENITRYLADDNISEALKIDFLMVIWEGGLVGCVAAVLRLLSLDTTSETLRSYCLYAVRAVGTADQKLEMARIATSLTDMSDTVIGHIFEALYPIQLGVTESLSLLRRAVSVSKYSYELQSVISNHLSSTLLSHHAVDFLRGLTEMVQEPPLSARSGVSRNYHWAMNLVPLCIVFVLERTTERAASLDTVLNAIMLVDSWLTNGSYEKVGTVDYVKRASQLLKVERTIRRALLWRRFANLNGSVKPNNFPMHKISPFNGLVAFDEGDIDWLVADVEQLADHDKKLVAMTLLLRVVKQNRRSKLLLAWRLRRSLSFPELRSVYLRHFLGTLRPAVVMRLMMHYRFSYSQRWWWSMKLGRISGVYRRLRSLIWLWTHLSELGAGRYPFALAELASGMISDGGSRFGVANWNTVARKWGPTIATRTARGCVAVWQQFVPSFPYETAERNTTDRRAIVGLIGLQTLWKEGKLDYDSFSAQDVERATRYACNELNGFPEWFFALANQRPAEVERALSAQIAAEFSLPSTLENVHDVIAKLAAAPVRLIAANSALLNALNNFDPRNAKVLEQTFTGLRYGGNDVKSALRRLAPGRVADYNVQQHQQFWTMWMATWMEIDAVPALRHLQATLETSPAEDADAAMERLCSRLKWQPHMSDDRATSSFRSPVSLQVLIPLVYAYVRPIDDIDRSNGGVYSPIARDNAQDFRHSLWEVLRSHESPEADNTLRSLLVNDELAERRDWVLSILEERQSKGADPEAWKPEDVRTFAQIHSHVPRSDYQMFELVCGILRDFKSEVETSESSTNRRLVRANDREELLQGVLEQKLLARSLDWFSVTKESEVDLGQRPDLRVERPELSPLPIEVKLANLAHWTLEHLLERLENQLVGQYLRPSNVNFGIYVVGNTSPSRRWTGRDGRRINFREVLQILEARAIELVANRRHEIHGLQVIGIDFSDPRERSD